MFQAQPLSFLAPEAWELQGAAWEPEDGNESWAELPVEGAEVLGVWVETATGRGFPIPGEGPNAVAPINARGGPDGEPFDACWSKGGATHFSGNARVGKGQNGRLGHAVGAILGVNWGGKCNWLLGHREKG